MGEVYRARDTKLDREVAIKILPVGTTGDAQMLSRFEREAKVLATLNHPNIATIHGIEEVGDSKAIVMELVEGETLEERLRRGPMESATALPVFRQIAEALDAAHEKGIVHRDLKPGNIKFTQDGQVKVLDFGLAKSTHGEGTVDSEAATVAAETTMPGAVLGTPAYMSPEQTRGEPVDKRTDVWAFGCCLYEALTGRKPFKAQTVSDLMAEVLRSDPDFTMVPVDTPAEIVSLLRRCLDKEPRRRLRDIGDIAIRLEETAGSASPPTPDARAGGQGRYLSLSVFVLLLGVLLGWLVPTIWKPAAPPADPAGEESEPTRFLAIAPFENQSGDEELDVFASNTPRELHQKLSTFRNEIIVKVISAEEAAAANSDAILSGIFSREDGMLKLDLTLDRQAGPESLPSLIQPESDILKIHSEAAILIAKQCGLAVSGSDETRMRSGDNVGREAWLLYCEGMEEMDKVTQESLNHAKKHFQDARREAPGFLPPQIMLSYVHWMPLIWGGEQVPPPEVAFPAAASVLEVAKQNLIHLGGDAADIERVELEQAYLGMLAEFKWGGLADEFDGELRKPLDEIDPHIYWIRCWYLLFATGNYHDARRDIEAAKRRAPYRVGMDDALAEIYSFMGEEEKAAALNQRVHEEGTNDMDRLLNLALNRTNLALLETDPATAAGQFDEILSLTQGARDKFHDHPGTLAVHAEVLAAAGHDVDARDLLKRVEKFRNTEGNFFPAVWIARGYARLAEPEDLAKAMDLLEESYHQREGNAFLYNLRKYDLMEMLEDEERYWKLIDDMGYPELPHGHRFRDKEQEMRFGLR